MSIDNFLRDINTIHSELLEPIWWHGRNPLTQWDGPHYRLRGFARPVSVSPCEAFFLSNLATLAAPATAVEIGIGFGYSAAWLAYGMTRGRADGRLFCIDNFSEGALGDTGYRVHREVLDRLALGDTVVTVHGRSPDAVDAALGDLNIDLAFVDGDHHGEQPVLDFVAVAKRCSDRSLILFHDVDPARYTVPRAIDRALSEGWMAETLETSCSLTVLYRFAEATETIAQAYALARRHLFVPDDEATR